MLFRSRFRARVGDRIGAPVAIVADGGGVDEWLAQVDDVERGRDLVLRGLALWAERSASADGGPLPSG